MIAIAAGHQCSPRSAADASSITGRRAWFRPVAILHDEPGLPGAEILHSGRIPSAMAPQDGAVRRIRRTPTRSRPSVMARPDHLVAMFGDGLAGDHRRGAGGSRSRSEDSHGQDQTRRAGGLWAGLAYQSRGRATTGPSRLPGPKPPANSPPRSHARKLPARSIRDGTGRTRCPLDRPGRTSSGPPGRRRPVARRWRAADRARPAGRG
jgi:hypothetical protein